MSTTPPFHRSPPAESNMSSLILSIFALLALIIIPTLIYTFFFAIKCPTTCNPFSRLRRRSDELAGDLTRRSTNTRNIMDLVSGSVVVKYDKEKEYGSECPVCLSAFADGDELRRLKACKHSFHVSCIDKWLNSHSNCPVCRASIAVRRSKSSAIDGEDDFRQGLPDSASLV